MELIGHIKVLGEIQTLGDKGYRKRDLVITTEGAYPQDILVEFSQDKCEVLNAYKVNDSVKIGINLYGREWTNPKGEVKYFNTIKGWKIEANSGQVKGMDYAPDREVSDNIPF